MDYIQTQRIKLTKTECQIALSLAFILLNGFKRVYVDEELVTKIENDKVQ